MTIFEGSAVALVLPMFDNGDIDFEGFKKTRFKELNRWWCTSFTCKWNNR